MKTLKSSWDWTFQSAVSQVFNLPGSAASQEVFEQPTRRRLESRRNGRLESLRYAAPLSAGWRQLGDAPQGGDLHENNC
jgi:hypothetical protein